MMRTEEQEYIDCLRDIRNQLIEQIPQHLSRIEQLQKKLDIATKALNRMVGNPPTDFPDCETYIWEAMQALKEMEEV